MCKHIIACEAKIENGKKRNRKSIRCDRISNFPLKEKSRLSFEGTSYIKKFNITAHRTYMRIKLLHTTVWHMNIEYISHSAYTNAPKWNWFAYFTVSDTIWYTMIRIFMRIFFGYLAARVWTSTMESYLAMALLTTQSKSCAGFACSHFI